MTCTDLSHLKKYRERPGPPYPANDPVCVGLVKKGNDGRLYVSTPSYNGVHRWVPVQPKTEPKPKPEPKSKPKSKAKPKPKSKPKPKPKSKPKPKLTPRPKKKAKARQKPGG